MSRLGLCQSGRAWWRELDGWLTNKTHNPECERCSTDTCVYHFKRGDKFVLLLVYVDDIISVSNDPSFKNEIKSRLFDRFKMTGGEELHTILGCQVNRDIEAGTLSFHQTRYIKDMLETFDPHSEETYKTPMSDSNVISHLDCPAEGSSEQQQMKKLPFRALVGSLMYAEKTRPDISGALSKVASFAQNPGMAHYNAALRILRYLRGTIDLRLTYRRAGGVTPTLFASSDAKSRASECRATDVLMAMCDADYAS